MNLIFYIQIYRVVYVRAIFEYEDLKTTISFYFFCILENNLPLDFFLYSYRTIFYSDKNDLEREKVRQHSVENFTFILGAFSGRWTHFIFHKHSICESQRSLVVYLYFVKPICKCIRRLYKGIFCEVVKTVSHNS